MKAAFPALMLILAGCGGSTPAENKAEQLENAAEQSTPGAAGVLENAADRIEDGDGQNLEAEVDRALNEAADVAANEQ